MGVVQTAPPRSIRHHPHRLPPPHKGEESGSGRSDPGRDLSGWVAPDHAAGHPSPFASDRAEKWPPGNTAATPGRLRRRSQARSSA